MVFVLCNRTIQLKAERDLKLSRLLAIISPYLAELIKHNWIQNLYEIVVIFLHFVPQGPLMWLDRSI